MTKVRLMSDARDAPLVEHLSSDPANLEAVEAEVSSVATSPGSLLRQAREAAGLNVAALAASLKVPVKKLEALEADRFDLLPDIVFARALASSVCRTLKIEAAPVLERLPRHSNAELSYRSVGINMPFRAPGNRLGPSVWAQVSRPAVLAGLVLLLGALVLVFLPALKSGVDANSRGVATTATNTQPSLSGETQGATDAVPAANLPPRLPVSPDSRTSDDVNWTKPASGSPSTVVPPSAAPAALQTLAVPAVPASAVSSLVSTGIVVFTAKGASWVEVTDSKGVIVLRRTLIAGEVVGASGTLPLAAIVGRADATQVQIRGNTFDVMAVAKDNVARFEVR